MFFCKQLSRALSGWSFVGSLLVSLTLMFLSLRQFYPLDPTPPAGFHPDYYNAYDAWRRGMDVFVLFAPLAATLPFASAYLHDRDHGLVRYILLRMRHRAFITSTFLVNGLAGGLAIAVPMLFFFGYTYTVYARTLPPLSATPYTEPWMWAPGFLGSYFTTHPNLYIVGRIITGFLFGMTYATLGMALSPFVCNRYIVLSVPFIFMWMYGFIVNVLGLPVWSSMYALAPDAIRDSTAITIFVPLSILFICSTVSIFIGIRKYSNDQIFY